MDKIIGISTKKSFGETESRVVLFKNLEQAEEWLNTEEYHFRDRELFTNEWKAIRALGKGGKKKTLKQNIMESVKSFSLMNLNKNIARKISCYSLRRSVGYV